MTDRTSAADQRTTGQAQARDRTTNSADQKSTGATDGTPDFNSATRILWAKVMGAHTIFPGESDYAPNTGSPASDDKSTGTA
jgi:hypothetical protein